MQVYIVYRVYSYCRGLPWRKRCTEIDSIDRETNAAGDTSFFIGLHIKRPAADWLTDTVFFTVVWIYSDHIFTSIEYRHHQQFSLRHKLRVVEWLSAKFWQIMYTLCMR